MNHNKRDFFWPSYVDLLTALFAVVLVLFIISFYNFKQKKDELEGYVNVLREDNKILNKVKSNLKLFDTDKDLFIYDSIHNRIQLAFDIKYKTGYEYYEISNNHISANYIQTKKNIDSLGIKMQRIINHLKIQKETDPSMKDISYLLVISGSASRWGDPDENFLLSYKRALSLYKYWKKELKIDFDSPQYHNIIELQIAGIGIGGVGRFNTPFVAANKIEEEKNQRFIIYITPKIGK